MAENGVRVQEKGQVTIPRAIRKKLNLKQGDLVIFQETEAGILIKPAAVVVEDNLRKEVTALVHAVREKFQDYSAEQIDVLVEQAVQTQQRQQQLMAELAVTLYAQGILSFGKAQALAGMERLAFGRLLGERGIPRHYTEVDLQDDVSYASGE
jgi:AbrB family looped-hinge helix DNA binding protein